MSAAPGYETCDCGATKELQHDGAITLTMRCCCEHGEPAGLWDAMLHQVDKRHLHSGLESLRRA